MNGYETLYVSCPEPTPAQNEAMRLRTIEVWRKACATHPNFPPEWLWRLITLRGGELIYGPMPEEAGIMNETELERVVKQVGGQIARPSLNQLGWVLIMPSHEGSIEVMLVKVDLDGQTAQSLADLLKQRARIAARQFAAGDRKRRLPDK